MIPIFINVFNRLECFQRLLKRLEGMKLQENIIIIDNASTYPPLRDFLSTTPYQIVQLERNYGSYALWDANVLLNLGFVGKPFMYTDPDIIPIPECPSDFILYFQEVLEKYPLSRGIRKVGFGLRIDNLPDNSMTRKVRDWESQYWEKEKQVPGENLYEGFLDTTFSMYRAENTLRGHGWGIRTGFPYIAEHTTWYEDFDALSEESQYYVRHLDPEWTHWFRERALINKLTQ